LPLLLALGVMASHDAIAGGDDVDAHLTSPVEPGDRNGPGPSFGEAAGVQFGSSNIQINYFGSGETSGAGARPPTPAPEAAGSPCRGHVFISYVREDSAEVDELQRVLDAAGVPVWRDTASLWPGEDWRAKIREAITQDALAFIACFSSRSAARQTTHQNEELLLAVEQLRSRRPNDPWLIPVRFDNCDIPDLDLGLGRTISSLQCADLFGANRNRAVERLVAAVQQRLRRPVPSIAESADPVVAAGNAADVLLHGGSERGTEPGPLSGTGLPVLSEDGKETVSNNRRKAKIVIGFLAVVIACIVIAGELQLLPFQSPATPVGNVGEYFQDGSHYFVNGESGGCLDQADTGGILNEGVLDYYPCRGDKNERWSVRPGPEDTFTLVNDMSHSCLDQDASGAALVIAIKCGSDQNQSWMAVKYKGLFFIVNKGSRDCLGRQYVADAYGQSVEVYSPCLFLPYESWTEQATAPPHKSVV
jgi:hypothetical protein